MREQNRFQHFVIILATLGIGALASASAPTVQGAPSAKATQDPLESVVQTGLAHAFAIQSQKLELEMAENRLPIARASLLPTLTLSSTKSYNGGETLDSTTGTIGYANSNSTTLGLSASWTLWDNYASIRRYQTTKKSLESTRIASHTKVQSYVLSLVKAYLDYQYQLSLREITMHRLDQAKLTNEESQALVRAGAKTKLDAMDTEIEVMNNERDLLEQENRITTSLHALQLLINTDQLRDLPRVNLLEHEPYYARDFALKLADIRANLKRKVEESNPDLRYSRIQLEIAGMDLAQTKLGYFPQTSVSLSHAYSLDRYVQDDPTGGWRTGLQSSAISLNLTWQFWDWMSTPYSIQNSKKTFENQLLSYRRDSAQSETDLENMVKDLAVIEKTIQASRLVLQKAETQAQYSNEMYRLGRLTLLEIQQATSRLADARSGLATRLKDRSTLIANILYSSGFDITPPGLDLSWIH